MNRTELKHISILWCHGIHMHLLYMSLINMFFFDRDGLFYVIKLMSFMVCISAAWCSIPVSISQMYTGAEEEGLLYSKLCNHPGKCCRGSRLCATATAGALQFPREQIRHGGFPISAAAAAAVISPQPSVWSICVKQNLFLFHGLEQVLTEGHFSQKGNSLLITAHNSCCISNARGKLSSMFHGLAMWAEVMRENVQGRRIRINLGTRLKSNSGKSALSRRFSRIFVRNLLNLILKCCRPTRDSLRSAGEIFANRRLFFNLSL